MIVLGYSQNYLFTWAAPKKSGAYLRCCIFGAGDMMLSGAASSVLVWKERVPPEEWEDDRGDDEDDDQPGGRRRPHIPEDQRYGPRFIRDFAWLT